MADRSARNVPPADPLVVTLARIIAAIAEREAERRTMGRAERPKRRGGTAA